MAQERWEEAIGDFLEKFFEKIFEVLLVGILVGSGSFLVFNGILFGNAEETYAGTMPAIIVFALSLVMGVRQFNFTLFGESLPVLTSAGTPAPNPPSSLTMDDNALTDGEEIILDPSGLFEKRFHLVFTGFWAVLGGGFLAMNFLLFLRSEEIMPGSQSAALLFLLSLPLFVYFSQEVHNPLGVIPAHIQRSKNEPAMIFSITVETPWIIFLVVARGLCLAILLVQLLVCIHTPESPIHWLARDALAGLILFMVLLGSTRCFYKIHPARKKILYRFSTPFFREFRDIDFHEVAAVCVTGRLKGWPLLLSYYGMEFTTVLVFQDGNILPALPPASCSTEPENLFRQQRTEAKNLANLLEIPFFTGPCTPEQSFVDWEKGILPLIQKSKTPKVLEQKLWELGLGSLSLESASPGKIRVDLPTQAEKVVLAMILCLMVGTTCYFLTLEWKYLAANPRVFYLILLDCTSVVATMLGLWRLLIDEYYILDTVSRSVVFYSRILFITREYAVAHFDAIKSLSVQVAGSESHAEFRAVLETAGGVEYKVSDQCFHGDIPRFRAKAVAKIIDSYRFKKISLQRMAEK